MPGEENYPGCAGRDSDGFGWGSVPVVLSEVDTEAENARRCGSSAEARVLSERGALGEEVLKSPRETPPGPSKNSSPGAGWPPAG